MVADRIAAACSMPARKLAGAAIAAESKMRLMVKPLLEVSATTEPTPPLPEPETAAMASTDSSGRTGATGVEAGRLLEIPPGPDEKWLNKRGAKLKPLPPRPRSASRSNGSESECDFIA